jgi:hypothetical protein
MFACLAVLAVRELLRLALGERAFARASALVQSVLVVALTTALLLLLGGAAGTAAALVDERASPVTSRVTRPAIWFLGLAEGLTGETIISGGRSGNATDDDLTRAFRRRGPRFRELATTGLMVLGGLAAFATAVYAWNSRRLPQPLARRRMARNARAWLERCASRVLVRSPMARAGFFFTICVLFRSAPHRVAMSVALAVALAVAAATLGGSTFARPPGAADARLSIWMLQTIVLMALTVGLRHALALPAELRANWEFQHAWCGQFDAFMTGVRRAAIVTVALPPVLALVPMHVYTLGVAVAIFHALTGLLVASVLIELILFGATKPPFISSYAPQGRMKAAPIYLVAAVMVALSIAWLERAATSALAWQFVFTIGLVACLAIIRSLDARCLRPPAVSFDDHVEPSAQTLGISG